MIPAYDKQYLDDAMRNPGEAVDFAVTVARLDMDEFMSMFIRCGIAKFFGGESRSMSAASPAWNWCWKRCAVPVCPMITCRCN